MVLKSFISPFFLSIIFWPFYSCSVHFYVLQLSFKLYFYWDIFFQTSLGKSVSFFMSNYFHLKKNNSIYFFLNILKYIMLRYLTLSNLNSIHWLIKKKKYIYIQALMYFSGHFMTIFRSNYFHLKLLFFFLNFKYSLNIC